MRPTWRVLALLGLVVAAYVNERFNLRNEPLERQLTGCWEGVGVGKEEKSRIEFDIRADGTFTEVNTIRIGGLANISVSIGDWSLSRNLWKLRHLKTTNTNLPLGPQGPYRFTVLNVNQTGLTLREDALARVLTLSRKPPDAAGGCATGT